MAAKLHGVVAQRRKAWRAQGAGADRGPRRLRLSGLRRGPRIFLPAPERSFSRVCLRLRRLLVKSLAAPDVCPPAPCIWLDGDDQNGAGLIPSPKYVASNSQRGAHVPLMPLTHLRKEKKEPCLRQS